jgi:hypothetical protein
MEPPKRRHIALRKAIVKPIIIKSKMFAKVVDINIDANLNLQKTTSLPKIKLLTLNKPSTGALLEDDSEEGKEDNPNEAHSTDRIQPVDLHLQNVTAIE